MKKQWSRPRLLWGLALWLLAAVALGALLGGGEVGTAGTVGKADIAGTFQRELTNRISPILAQDVPALTVKKTYQLNDSDLVSPKPNPNGYGQVQEPARLQPILEQAKDLLDGQTTLFSPDIQIKEDSAITYYLDETILAITWKQVVDGCCYTFSEVKIADASQFRRFLADGKYNSGQLYTTTEMASSVNAVVASSGDYYGYRSIGIVVNDGHVYRGRGHYLDTCYIDDQGDLLFTYAGEITDEQAAQTYVDQHNIRFSLCFGPVMVRDGEACVPPDYNSGEINSPYARAALCQWDKLHYVVVTANNEPPCYKLPRVSEFGKNLQAMGIPTVYALDGGQTAAIAMDGQLINTVSYGSQREISDIFYFATAVPNYGSKEATP